MDTPARRSHATGSCGPLCRPRRSHHPGSRPGPRTDEFRPLSPPGQTVAWTPNWGRFGTKLSHLHSTGGVIGSKVSHGGGPPGVPSIQVEVFPTELETLAIGVEAYPTDVERYPTGAGMLATGAGMLARKLSHAGHAEETVACTFAPTVYRATVVEAFSTAVEAFSTVVETSSTVVEAVSIVVEASPTDVEARRPTWSRPRLAWSRLRRNCRTTPCRPRGTPARYISTRIGDTSSCTRNASTRTGNTPSCTRNASTRTGKTSSCTAFRLSPSSGALRPAPASSLSAFSPPSRGRPGVSSR